jgi:hypothetical protein
MKKRIFALSLGRALAVGLCACGSETQTTDSEETTQPEETSQPLDLTGTWQMSNGKDGASILTATISGEEIEVLWDIDGEQYLYWAGTYTAPTDTSEPYSWTSEASDRNTSALLASTDATKDFTYSGDVLSFDVVVDGESSNVEMKKIADASPVESEDVSESALGADVDLGQYIVSIDSASLATDDEGNDVIVVSYTWTNNSDDSQMASVALLAQAYQDGIQIDSAYLYGDSNFDFDAADKNIRPGVTQSVVCAFTLENKTSPVEVEISDWTDFSSSKVIAAYTFDPAEL